MEDFQLFTSLRYDPALTTVGEQGYTNTGWNDEPSPFYMLDFSRDRMLRAARYWGWQPAIDTISGEGGLKRLEDLLASTASKTDNEPQRVRITLSREGKLDVELHPAGKADLRNLFPSVLPVPAGMDAHARDGTGRPPLKDPVYEIMLDELGTTTSEYTHFKTTNRGMYGDARKRARINMTDCKEVLLVNGANDSIMEGSISTPYFWRNGRWVTPPVSSIFDGACDSGGNDGTTRRWALERGLAVEEVVLAKDLVNGEECWISNAARGFCFGRIKLA